MPREIFFCADESGFQNGMNRDLPSREVTYRPQTWHFEDDFPFPQVGYVNSLEGISGVKLGMKNYPIIYG